MEHLIGKEKTVRSWKIEVTDIEGNYLEVYLFSIDKRNLKTKAYWINYHQLIGLRIWEGYDKIPSTILKEVFKLVEHKDKKRQYVSIVDKYDNTIDSFKL